MNMIPQVCVAQRATLEASPHLHLACSDGQGLFSTVVSDRLVGSQSSGHSPVSTPHASIGVLGSLIHVTGPGFIWTLGIQTMVFILVWQKCSSPLSNLLSLEDKMDLSSVMSCQIRFLAFYHGHDTVHIYIKLLKSKNSQKFKKPGQRIENRHFPKKVSKQSANILKRSSTSLITRKIEIKATITLHSLKQLLLRTKTTKQVLAKTWRN